MTVTEDFAEDLAIIHDPESKEAFHVEQHGIDFIPESERWATPRDVFGMWAGASVQIEYFIYGAILMTFGLTFAQVLFVIVLGNLSYFLLGLCSLQGPNAGTTVFAINRAPFGPNGSRPISFFNWITQIGFEVEGLILIVGAGLVLMIKAGYLPGDPAKVVLVIVAVLIQGILPFFGHAAIVKTLRLLVLPFLVLFAVLLGLRHPARQPAAWSRRVATGRASWRRWPSRSRSSGLGWTENGNDYTRYCPTNTSKKGIVGMGVPRHGRAGDPDHDARRRGRDVRPQDRHRVGRPFAVRPHERHPVVVRRRVPRLRHRADLRDQQPGHVLVRASRCRPSAPR